MTTFETSGADLHLTFASIIRNAVQDGQDFHIRILGAEHPIRFVIDEDLLSVDISREVLTIVTTNRINAFSLSSIISLTADVRVSKTIA